jgi:hypothetical protein
LAAAHIRTVNLKSDQILTVHTALGIATIVETPTPIQGAVIGDQSAFKIEYLDHAVTIKPLRAHARTNLYLQTADERFDFTLETRDQQSADYVVYVKSKNRTVTKWRSVRRKVSEKSFTLTCRRIAELPHAQILLDMELASKVKDKIRPDSVWVYQGTESKTINNLFISKLEVSNGHPTMIGISLSRADFDQILPIRVAIHLSNSRIELDLPKAVLWK